MIAITEQNHAAGRAFDSVAEAYDGLFTNSLIGRAQRSVVWKRAAALFPAGSRVLELNCGTGEDAAFLASRGVAVTACDVSARMIEQAQQRRVVEGGGGSVEYHVLPSEQIDELPSQQFFDGAFSNFSGLNCVSDLSDVAGQLAKRLRPGAPVLFCMSTRFCVWEMLYYLAKLDTKRAFRRCKGILAPAWGQRLFLSTIRCCIRCRDRFSTVFQASVRYWCWGLRSPVVCGGLGGKASVSPALVRESRRDCVPLARRESAGRSHAVASGEGVTMSATQSLLLQEQDGGLAMQLQCPRCNTQMEGCFCDRCGFSLRQEHGIWRAMPEERLAHYAQFVRDYEHVRSVQGRGSPHPEFYRQLPYKDLSGVNSVQWAMRARTFDYLISRLVKMPRVPA